MQLWSPSQPAITVYDYNYAIGVALVFLLLTLSLFTPCSNVSIVNFEQVNAGWVHRLWNTYSLEEYLFLVIISTPK